jgi:hypothetical protein
MQPVNKIPVKRHPNDLYFRIATTDLINMARKEIHVVTGEFSIMYFSDVREAFREAIENRNVSVKAYLGKCDVDTINTAIVNNIVVYHERKLPKRGEHYLVIDRKHVIVSEKHKPYAVGRRHGYIVPDNEEFALDKLSNFDSLIAGLPRTTKPISFDKRARELITNIYN